MIAFLSEYGATLVVCAILLLVVVAVVLYMIRSKKRGKSVTGCGCGCGNCAMSAYCHSKSSEKSEES